MRSADHEVEHAAHSADPFAGRIAVMAILATIGAVQIHGGRRRTTR
jgi:hypothetical protein